jgi:hypothetical protein
VCFHCLLVEKSIVRKELHNGDYDLARRKHFTMLLTNKIRRALTTPPERRQTFRVWVDPLHSRYAKAHDAVEVIGNNIVAAPAGRRDAFDAVHTHDSRDTASIQLSDLLVGAIAAAWEGDVVAEAKLDLQTDIAWHLSWPDLVGDTRPVEKKFNVRVFHDRRRVDVDQRRVPLSFERTRHAENCHQTATKRLSIVRGAIEASLEVVESESFAWWAL